MASYCKHCKKRTGTTTQAVYDSEDNVHYPEPECMTCGRLK